MPKEPNRAAEMTVFAGWLGRATSLARRALLGLSPSAVSKLVSRLEARLGTRLFRRSTRRLALTPEGEIFHARALAILAEIEGRGTRGGRGASPNRARPHQ